MVDTVINSCAASLLFSVDLTPISSLFQDRVCTQATGAGPQAARAVLLLEVVPSIYICLYPLHSHQPQHLICLSQTIIHAMNRQMDTKSCQLPSKRDFKMLRSRLWRIKFLMPPSAPFFKSHLNLTDMTAVPRWLRVVKRRTQSLPY